MFKNLISFMYYIIAIILSYFFSIINIPNIKLKLPNVLLSYYIGILFF